VSELAALRQYVANWQQAALIASTAIASQTPGCTFQTAVSGRSCENTGLIQAGGNCYPKPPQASAWRDARNRSFVTSLRLLAGDASVLDDRVPSTASGGPTIRFGCAPQKYRWSRPLPSMKRLSSCAPHPARPTPGIEVAPASTDWKPIQGDCSAVASEAAKGYFDRIIRRTRLNFMPSLT